MEGEKESLKKEYLPKESSSSCLEQESCCSSLFTLSIDSSRQLLAAEREVTSLLKSTSSKHEDEDYMTHQFSFDKSKSWRGRKDNEVEVESLSCWLLDTEKSPQKNIASWMINN